MKHKNKNNKNNKIQSAEKEPEVPTTSLRTLNIISYAILIGIFLLSLYVRAIRPFKNAFINGIPAFAIDDAVMHMRLVENTIKFFPTRIFFDAYTRYPFGTHLHWGPLTDQLIALSAIIVGLGNPSQDTINLVGMLFPAVFGALTVIPAFFIGKYLHSNKAGIIVAFLVAILPGQWLARSSIGFTDNHVLEVFFTTVMMAFFIITLKKSANLKLIDIVERNWQALKIPLFWSVLTGIALGSYIQAWSNGMMFVGIIFLFVLLQTVIDHLHGRSSAYLAFNSVIIYFITLIMVLPYFDGRNGMSITWYSWYHVVVLILAMISSVACVIVSEWTARKDLHKASYPIILVSTMFLIVTLMRITSPDLYSLTFGQISMMIGGRTEAGLTITEAMPTPNSALESYFGYNYIISYAGILLLIGYIFKTRKPEYTLTLVWSLLILTIMLSQVRFTYYYAINIAILVGLASGWIMDLVGWKKLDIMNPKAVHSVSLITIIVLTSFLPLATSPYKTTMDNSQYAQYGDGFFEWYESLHWMQNNTPDPGLPYNSLYVDPRTKFYPYPESAYGVMSWWDYGHIITYWAHRIPNANPFQEGIGGTEGHNPGASTFLTASSEEDANKVLDGISYNGKPGAKYIISNAYMMYSIQPVFAQWNKENPGNYFVQIRTNNGVQTLPSIRSYSTMEAKLHMFDGDGLKQYRLVHESNPNPNTRGGNEEIGYKQVWNGLYKGSVSIENSGYVKIFEYLKGAVVKGSIEPNTTVKISVPIRTNIGRRFTYTQTTMSDSNGDYSFTVPYSTGKPIPEGTQFDTMPTEPYKIVYNNSTISFNITETAVINGEQIILLT